MSAAPQTDTWTPPRAAGGWVLIVPDEPETVTDSGIFLGRAREQVTGIVVSIGAWAKEHFPGVEVGDRVVWQRDHNSEYVWDGVRVCALTLRTCCPHCKGELAEDGVLGVAQ
tara:strand:- start:587 stop:922 length:336 start_codon:yes stop_codon:yes gene_type:complete